MPALEPGSFPVAAGPPTATTSPAEISARRKSTIEESSPPAADREPPAYTSPSERIAPPGLAPPAARRSEPALMTVASPSSLLGPVLTESGFDTPPAPACDRPALLESLAGVVAGCRKCAYLAETRTQTVFGTGSAETRLMFVGEAPGADEDRQGKPFVGRAGQLLTDMITKGMGLSREQVYIANVLKCRPPENRTPTDIESNNCIGYLEEQIAIIRPQFICLLGKSALLVGTAQKAPPRWERPAASGTVLGQGHPDDGHVPSVWYLAGEKPGCQLRSMARPSNAHERDGVTPPRAKALGRTG